jgi:hypothetical protein
MLISELGENNGRSAQSNLAAAAAITSKARVKLAELLKEIEASGCDITYIDTDCVYFTGDARGLSVKYNTIDYFELRGPRDYSSEEPIR